MEKSLEEIEQEFEDKQLDERIMRKDRPQTHEVLDLTYLPEEGQGCYSGSEQDCIDFVYQQTRTGGFNSYQVVPIV